MSIEVSKILTVRVKTDLHIRAKDALAKSIMMDSNKYIGSSLNKSTRKPKSGLTITEEKLLLGNIIGLVPEDPTWNKAVEDYWGNIRQAVDPYRGLTLEIGFSFPTKELAIKYSNYEYPPVDNIWSMLINENNIKLGIMPINVADFVLYRYLLVYNRCANRPEDKDLSNNILFYLEDPDRAKKLEIDKRTIVKNARKKLETILVGDSKITDALLRVIAHNHGNSNSKYYFNLEDLDTITKEFKLDDFVDEYPNQFLIYCADQDLAIKNLILNLIEQGILIKVPNTELIKDESNNVLIGNSLLECVAWFKATPNKKAVDIYQARLTKVEV